ncbi:MAG: hypothetical protein HYT07_00985 [Candidatus Levybacteria bacterium]|nr:hypothetical protein [Candidatus Levybacteria bacterium]
MMHKFQISNFKFQISEGGQALTTLLIFVIIAVTITSGAIVVLIANTTSTSKIQEGLAAYYAAESGVENALLRLLRDPNYTGETLSIDTSTAEITVTGSNPKTVVSVGQNGNFKRTVQVQMNYNSGYYTFSSWKEI